MIRPPLAARIILCLNICRRALYGGTFTSYSSEQASHHTREQPLHHTLRWGILASYFFSLLVLGGALTSYLSPAGYAWLFLAAASVIQTTLSFTGEGPQSSGKRQPVSDDCWVEDLGGGKGLRVAAYIRVSTDKQAQRGHSLDVQEKELRELARKIGASRIYWFRDAGKSGVDFDRRKLNLMLDLAERREIEKVLIVDVDRLGRNSRKLLNFLCDLRDCGVTIQTPEGELDIDQLEGLLLSVTKAWRSQYDNEKRAKQANASKAENFLKGHWNKPIPKGYRKRSDGWIERDLSWESVIRDIFELFLRFRSYGKVAETINAKYGKSLTRQQVAQLLRDPVYIGKPAHLGKVVEDPSLAFVNEETFKKAQEIADLIHRKHSRKGRTTIQDLLREYGAGVLEFVPNIAVLCPSCQGIMVRNGTVSLGAGHTAQIYFCRKCHKELKIPTKRQMQRIQEWVRKEFPSEGIPATSRAGITSEGPAQIQRMPKRGKPQARRIGPAEAKFRDRALDELIWGEVGKAGASP